MKRQLWALASALLLTGTPTAFAVGKGVEGSRAEISGTVVKAEPKMLYLSQNGAIVPIKLDDSTKFEGDGLNRYSDLRVGEEVKADITVKKTENMGNMISKGSAMGGSPTTPSGSTTTPPSTPPSEEKPTTPSPAPTEPRTY